MTDNLDLEQIASNQSQKEASSNLADSQLMKALTEILEVDLYLGDVVLTDLEFQRNICFACDGQLASQSLTIPDIKRGLFVVQNKSGAFGVDVTHGATVITLAASASGIFKSDGTADDLIQLA